MNFEFLNKQEYLTKNIYENYEIIVYSVVSFFVSFLIGHPQAVVGVIVNSMLVLASLNIKNFKLLSIIVMPSLGALSRGLLFGPFTLHLVKVMPIIWLGNTILVFSIKLFYLHLKLNKYLSLIIGAGTKALLLFSAALALVKINLLPQVFLTAMGIMQLYTALTGGILAFWAQKKLKQKKLKSEN